MTSKHTLASALLQLLAVLLLGSYSSIHVHAQDLQIFGKFELAAIELDAREIGRIRSKCFWGWGFPTCNPQYQVRCMLIWKCVCMHMYIHRHISHSCECLRTCHVVCRLILVCVSHISAALS